MYITEADIINFWVKEGKKKSESEMIRKLIELDLIDKVGIMEGQRYYDYDHDVLYHSFNEYKVNNATLTDENATNTKLVN
ncbi:MAG: hypothetical protein ABIC04_01265, partial [Nanoarchaeota archaeon]